MSEASVGWLAVAGTPVPEVGLDDKGVLEAVEPTVAGVHAARPAVWLVQTPGVDGAVLRRIRDGDVPALFVVPHDEAAAWLRTLRKGVHDVAWLPFDAGEVRARLLSLLARRTAWSPVAGALCRELAHDLRGPLQALSFTVAALRSDGAVAEGFEEDVDALLEAADKADLILNGVANLGREARAVDEATPEVDVVELLRRTAARRSFGGTVAVEAGEAVRVRAHPDAMSSALEDLVRVVWIRAAGHRQVRVQVLPFGGEVVITASAPAYPALLDHAEALLWRERPILLRRDRVPLPLAGLAYAREVLQAAGGALAVRREDRELVVEARLPLP